MRGLQWKKIPENKLPGTIWFTLNDLQWEQRVKLSLVEEKFMIADPNSVGVKEDAKRVKQPAVASFLTFKQSTNLEIALKKIGDHGAVVERLLRMEEGALPIPLMTEALKVIEGNPSIAGLDINSQHWSKAEMFILALVHRVPLVDVRLNCFLLKAGFEEWLTIARKDCDIFQLAAKALLHMNDDWRGCLEIILLIGNYMNHGTVRGQARGIELDSFSIVPFCYIVSITNTHTHINTKHTKIVFEHKDGRRSKRFLYARLVGIVEGKCEVVKLDGKAGLVLPSRSDQSIGNI